jgi:hypothetical protein
MPQNSLSRQFVEFLPSGMNSDITPYALPPEIYTMARNVRFVGNSAQRMGGAIDAFPNGTYVGAPEFLFQTVINGKPWTLYGGAFGVGVTDGTTHFNVTPAGWLAPPEGSVTAGIFNNVICFASPAAAPWYWDGTTIAGAVKPLPGWFPATQCRVLRAFNSFLFAGDLTDTVRRQDRLAWSDAAPSSGIPSTWTPTTTNQAGNLDLSDVVGAIIDMRPLADFLMVYKGGGAYAVSHTGRPYIFSKRRITGAIGAASPNAIAELRGRHVVFGFGDVVITDGSTVQSIIDKKNRNALFGSFNASAAGVAFALHNQGKNEIWICLPSAGATRCNLAGVWNYNADTWSIRDLPQQISAGGIGIRVAASAIPPSWNDLAPRTWQQWEGNWFGIFYGETQVKVFAAAPGQGKILEFDSADTDLGTLIEGKLEKTTIPIGGTQLISHYTRLTLRLNGVPGATFRVRAGVQMNPSDPIEWGQETPIVLGSSNDLSLDMLMQGRYFSMSVRNYDAAPWAVSGFAVEYFQRGVR